MTIDLPAPGAADARARMLERLGRHAQWAVVSWWRIDGERLLCADVWQADPAAHPRFIKATMVRRFALGEGLPGRVWAAGAAEWIPDVVADANFPRVGLALQEQLRAACAFPVVHDGHVTGVIEMYGDTVAPIDAELLLALESIGRLCGAVTGGATPG